MPRSTLAPAMPSSLSDPSANARTPPAAEPELVEDRDVAELVELAGQVRQEPAVLRAAAEQRQVAGGELVEHAVGRLLDERDRVRQVGELDVVRLELVRHERAADRAVERDRVEHRDVEG